MSIDAINMLDSDGRKETKNKLFPNCQEIFWPQNKSMSSSFDKTLSAVTSSVEENTFGWCRLLNPKKNCSQMMADNQSWQSLKNASDTKL